MKILIGKAPIIIAIAKEQLKQFISNYKEDDKIALLDLLNITSYD